MNHPWILKHCPVPKPAPAAACQSEVGNEDQIAATCHNGAREQEQEVGIVLLALCHEANLCRELYTAHQSAWFSLLHADVLAAEWLFTAAEISCHAGVGSSCL